MFKNELSKKPQEQIDIDAYDAVYFDRDGRHQHVIKFKKPGGSEYWFSAESKEKADEWLQVRVTSLVLHCFPFLLINLSYICTLTFYITIVKM